MSLTAQPFTFYAGDTTSLTVALLKDGSAFTPGTAYNLIFTAKRNLLDEDRSALFQYSTGIGVTHSTTNAVVAIHPIDTRYLGGKTLQFDIKAQDLSTGDVVATVAIGTLVVTKNVGRLTTTSVAIHTATAGSPYGVSATAMAGAITAASTITPITGDEIAPALSGGVLGKFTYSAIKAWMLDGISSAWADITGKPAFGGASLLEVGTTAGTVAAGDHNHSGVYQPADANIVSVSTPADNDFIQRVSGSWVTRTIAQVKTALGLGTAAYTASTDYATALGADDNYVTDTQKAALHAAATVTGNGIAITGQALSLSIGTGSTQVAAGNHTHSGVYAESSHTHVSANVTDASTGGNGATDYGKLVKFGGEGGGITFSGTNTFGVSGNSTNGNGVRASSSTGDALSAVASGNGVNYHATFGNSGDDRSFVARLLGALGWWRGAYTLMVSAVDTLTADRVQRFPDKDGTLALTSDISGTNSGTNTGDETGARIAALAGDRLIASLAEVRGVSNAGTCYFATTRSTSGTLTVKTSTGYARLVNPDNTLGAQVGTGVAGNSFTLTIPASGLHRAYGVISVTNGGTTRSGNITILNLTYNQLTTFSGTGLSSLTGLYLGNNQLTTFSGTGLSTLITLYIDNNQLTAFSGTGLSALTDLNLGNNQLTEFSGVGLSALTSLNLGNNQITTFSGTDLSLLAQLYLSNNQLTEFSATGMSAVDTLYIQSNNLTSILATGLNLSFYVYGTGSDIGDNDLSLEALQAFVDSLAVTTTGIIEYAGNPGATAFAAWLTPANDKDYIWSNT